MENSNISELLSKIYQTGFTLFFIGMFVFSATMVHSYIKESKYINAGGNLLLAIFCLFGVLVRFGLITSPN